MKNMDFLKGKSWKVWTDNEGYKPVTHEQIIRIVGELEELRKAGKDFVILFKDGDFILQEAAYVPSMAYQPQHHVAIIKTPAWMREDHGK